MSTIELKTAQEFIKNGIPLFRLIRRPPHKWSAGELVPSIPRWQHLEPDPSVLDDLDAIYYGLAMVTGIVFDVIDIDPRNGGRESWRMLQDANAIPEIYLAVKTPRNGIHYYISKTGLPSRSSFLPGIDLKAGKKDGTGRGYVCFPGTVRINVPEDSQTRGKYQIVDGLPLKWEEEVFPRDKTQGFVEFVTLLMTQISERNRPLMTNSTKLIREDDLDERGRALVNATAKKAIIKLEKTPVGEQSNQLYKTCCYFGGLITGSGLNENAAIEAILITAKKMGFEEKYVLEKIARGFSWGKERPINIFHLIPKEGFTDGGDA